MPNMNNSEKVIELILPDINHPELGLTKSQSAKILGITRQAIGQLYDKYAPIPYTILLQERKEKIFYKEFAERNAKLDEVKYVCIACGKPVKYGDPKAQYSEKLCNDCRQIVTRENRDPTVTCVCKICGKEFHPNRNWKYRKVLPKYCPEHAIYNYKSQ